MVINIYHNNLSIAVLCGRTTVKKKQQSIYVLTKSFCWAYFCKLTILNILAILEKENALSIRRFDTYRDDLFTVINRTLGLLA